MKHYKGEEIKLYKKEEMILVIILIAYHTNKFIYFISESLDDLKVDKYTILLKDIMV